MSIELAPPLVGPTFRAQENADNVARMIRNLAEGRTCGETLARLPKVMPASQLRDDPWGNAWSIRCYGDLAVVRSAGADAVFGTYDDIVDVAVGAQVDR